MSQILKRSEVKVSNGMITLSFIKTKPKRIIFHTMKIGQVIIFPVIQLNLVCPMEHRPIG